MALPRIYKTSEKEREYKRQYFLKNKEKVYQQGKKWREAHKKELQEYQKQWRSNPEHKYQYKDYQRNRAKQLRILALRTYGGIPPKCSCCGETEIKFLAIDHI